MIRIVLPYHLRNLASIKSEVHLDVSGDITIHAVLTTLEMHYPMLAGTIRDHLTKQRRPFIRYYACGEDLSLEPSDRQLPPQIISGEEPFVVLGALAGG
jgi:sulfur-carrier protein